MIKPYTFYYNPQAVIQRASLWTRPRPEHGNSPLHSHRKAKRSFTRLVWQAAASALRLVAHHPYPTCESVNTDSAESCHSHRKANQTVWQAAASALRLVAHHPYPTCESVNTDSAESCHSHRKANQTVWQAAASALRLVARHPYPTCESVNTDSAESCHSHRKANQTGRLLSLAGRGSCPQTCGPSPVSSVRVCEHRHG
ncbi:hypothetical protein J6590_024874 [Homalodisca vitripennis]|nr:hypothetical protein J6590_024874 [Homalodisca vitripennis]